MFRCANISHFRWILLGKSRVSVPSGSLVRSPALSELVLKNESVNSGSTHVVQNQGSDCSLPSSLYSLTDMLMHLQCSQRSHESHCIPAWLPLTGLLQVPQGNLQLLGPGLVRHRRSTGVTTHHRSRGLIFSLGAAIFADLSHPGPCRFRHGRSRLAVFQVQSYAPPCHGQL